MNCVVNLLLLLFVCYESSIEKVEVPRPCCMSCSDGGGQTLPAYTGTTADGRIIAGSPARPAGQGMGVAVTCNVCMLAESSTGTKTDTGRFLAGFLELVGSAVTGNSRCFLRIDESSSESESEELLDRSESIPKIAASVLGEGLMPPLGASLGGEPSLDSSVPVRDTVTGRLGDIGGPMNGRPDMDIGGMGPPIRMAIII
jgi:hypothetical protein